ncbi:MAG: hypothetical protein XU11_C0003G0052 [Candidatus Dadabacteria bacterium CSP1-2]|jgi:hypothetical protein|nr:MAG: hypothetical protein XU11_C0003G0052 [Candidatus Dadabacteria bacterium CSP1-2]OGE21682.1 MAG: hypothetical protein A2V51_05600 [Candidatus Dadabacteria bacterium RBG_19FT_COMBO_40_33]
MSDFIKDLLGELIDDYVTQIEGDIRIGLLDNEVVIDPLISATVIEKKSGKKEFRVKDVDAHELKIKEQ